MSRITTSPPLRSDAKTIEPIELTFALLYTDIDKKIFNYHSFYYSGRHSKPNHEMIELG